ncbi:MAG: hypothetical protein HY513_03280 [Candidatus Aenigmarchaeota archaeon]|nr:hypothetical protein [Candidatus Aenigmarchaeota archaeon]
MVSYKTKPTSKLHEEFQKCKDFIDLFLSHHKNCSCFKEHVLSINKLRICVGCLFAAFGIVAAVVLFKSVYYSLISPLHVVLFGGSLMLISFFSMSIAQSKIPRAVRKFILGFGIPFYYYTSFAVHWIFVAIFMASIPLYAYVSISNHDDAEKSCCHKFKPTKRKTK